ncbi:MAG: hypothetical protein IPI03_21095 [Rubrivivax sp.]|nr:hypothetical protein [Rubrivivax sp.]
MSPSDRAAAFTARQRHQLAGVLLVWALFIVYGSWVPLSFQPRDWPGPGPRCGNGPGSMR